MTKRIAVLALAALLLAGCADPRENVQPKGGAVELEHGQLFVQVIEVNGRPISCVVFSSTSKGGVSCDFTREAKP
jgi:PBP1b-binding outer membrane lipoprotein LpoB